MSLVAGVQNCLISFARYFRLSRLNPAGFNTAGKPSGSALNMVWEVYSPPSRNEVFILTTPMNKKFVNSCIVLVALYVIVVECRSCATTVPSAGVP